MAEQCKNLVRDTRMMQQATARQEKKWVHGDEDAKKKENEFRVALQQNDGLKVRAPSLARATVDGNTDDAARH